MMIRDDGIIKRIESLIGEGPAMLKGGMHNRWLRWRQELVIRLAAEAIVIPWGDYRTAIVLDIQPARRGDELATKLEIAVRALEFECGNRCAHQNPCNAREALERIKT